MKVTNVVCKSNLDSKGKQTLRLSVTYEDDKNVWIKSIDIKLCNVCQPEVSTSLENVVAMLETLLYLDIDNLMPTTSQVRSGEVLTEYHGAWTVDIHTYRLEGQAS